MKPSKVGKYKCHYCEKWVTKDDTVKKLLYLKGGHLGVICKKCYIRRKVIDEL